MGRIPKDKGYKGFRPWNLWL